MTFRDLIWSLRSPSLLTRGASFLSLVSDEDCAQFWQRGAERLREHEADPAALTTFLLEKKRSGRLGDQFEGLLHFWLSEILRVPQLIRGLPIREGKETRGELDFVFEDQGVTHHWEAAVKFYMCLAESPNSEIGLDSFVGQALLDRLDLKLEHLSTHQLPQVNHPQAIEVIRSQGLHGPIWSRIFMKGRLFYPLVWHHDPHRLPEEISPAHERGWYLAWGRDCFEQNFGFTREYETWRWVILAKERWLASPQVDERETSLVLQSMDELIRALDRYFQGNSNAVQVALLRKNGEGFWREDHASSEKIFRRGMILKPGWPISVKN